MPHVAQEHLTALLGTDPFVLAADIEAAAIEAGKARAAADHAERVRTVKRAEAERLFRANAEGRVTVQEVEAAALTSPMYREHLDEQRKLEEAASAADAHYYKLRNAADWLHKAADSLRAETYLSR